MEQETYRKPDWQRNPINWIPVVGALYATYNFRPNSRIKRQDSPFCDTPSEAPNLTKIKDISLRLGWFGYQAVSGITSVILALKGLDSLLK